MIYGLMSPGLVLYPSNRAKLPTPNRNRIQEAHAPPGYDLPKRFHAGLGHQEGENIGILLDPVF